jgi:5-oxoprolinase (ATP-hydrolysing)
MAGGEPGTPGRNSVLRTDGSVSPLGPFDQTEMGAGDVFVIESPGGGGYGAVR